MVLSLRQRLLVGVHLFYSTTGIRDSKGQKEDEGECEHLQYKASTLPAWIAVKITRDLLLFPYNDNTILTVSW